MVFWVGGGGFGRLFPLIGRLPVAKGQSSDPLLIGHAILLPFRAMTYLVNLVERKGPGKAGPPVEK